MHTPHRPPRLAQLAAAALTIAALATPLSAQERIYHGYVPDMTLLDTTAPWLLDEDNEEGFNLKLGVGAEALREYGLSAADATTGSAFASARLGLRDDATRFVQLRGDLALYNAWGDDPSPYTTTQERLTGDLKLRATLGLGDVNTETLGVDLELNYHLVASGVRPLKMLRTDVGPEPSIDDTLTLIAWPRFAGDADLTAVAPVRYTLRKVQYTNAGATRLPVGGFVTHSISSGLGARGYEDEFWDGWLEIIGVTWSRTSFITPDATLLSCLDAGAADCDRDPSVAAAALLAEAEDLPALPGDIERIDLRALSFNDVILNIDDELLLDITVQLGGSWLWDEAAQRDMALFAWRIGTGLSGEWGRFGFASAREGTHTPDGRRLVHDLRLESFLDLEHPEAPIGLHFDTSMSILTDPDLYTTNEDTGYREYDARTRAALHSRWFVQPIERARLGLYHLADYPRPTPTPNWDPWAEATEAGRWNHELGAYLRLDL